MKRIGLIFLFLILVHPAWALDPAPLEKADAKRILETMNWTQVTVVAIRQGVDANGVVAPIYATVVGLGMLGGQHHSTSRTLYFDQDLGWHCLELTDKSARIWTANGVRDVKPWAQW